EGPIKIENATGWQRASGARHQALRRAPWRDVDHVDCNDGVGASERPSARRRVEFYGSQQVRQLRRRAVRLDAMKGIGVVVAGLPRKMRQSGCEMHGMFAGTACDLQYYAARKQDPLQHSEDRLP